MLNAVLSIPRGLLVSLAAHQENAERRAGAPDPQTGPRATAPKPEDSGPGVRFDFSAQGAAGTDPAAAARGAATPWGQRSSGEPAGRAPGARADDEAMARAWAVRTVARENTLTMIGRIARLAEQPGPAKAPADGAGKAPEPAEPKTPARA